MPSKTFYIKNASASVTYPFGSLQDGGTLTTATTGTGWVVGGVGIATPYDAMSYGTKRTGTFISSVPNSAPGAYGAGVWDAWRTESTLTGTFLTGTWTFSVSVIAVTATASGSGRLRIRLWKSANPSASSPTELTGINVITSAWSNLTTAAAQNISNTQSINQFSLSNEYLFMQVACELITFSAAAGADVLIRVDTANSRIVTPSFTTALLGTVVPGGTTLSVNRGRVDFTKNGATDDETVKPRVLVL